MNSGNQNPIVKIEPTANNPQPPQNAPIDHSLSCNVMKEIEKLQKEIDDLIAKAPRDDPEYKSSMKKLGEIKKFLAKKAHPSSVTNLLQRMSKQKKRVNVTPSDENEIFESRSDVSVDQDDANQDLTVMHVDDSILYGIECILSAYDFIRQLGSQ